MPAATSAGPSAGASLVSSGGLVAAQEEADQGVRGMLRDGEGEPIPDVTLTVSDSAGDEVGQATTDADGQWMIPVPEPGTYTILLDEGTLPEGAELQDPERNPLEVQVTSGRVAPAVFQLGEEEEGRQQIQAFLRSVANGIKFGLIIAMTAVGLSLVFSTTRLINFAHGDLVATGALLAWFFNVGLANMGGPSIHLIPASIITIVLVALLGAGLERGLFRPLRQRRLGIFQLLIITIGVGLAIRHVLLLFFGGSPRTYRDFVGQEAVQMGPVSLTPRDMTIMGLSVLLLGGVAMMLQRTRMGKSIRAVADNPALASASGIDVDRVILTVWILGAGLAATGGIFFGSAVSADWFMGFRLLLLMFAAVILGGIGTAYGAMAGGLVIGLVTELSVLWFPPELKFMWALLALIVVLLVRPQGILGRRERVG
ncbi:branched-chain amino acid ABC transporter permease [Actinobacteria bacterium YIM 96077]|uniref:Branched-chain amino acid ABC transporter permease n=2 Tax=Phytoactinopolyspora halophila TaxID=1981511 RepID=A0A329QA23_9ACTN|nr:branched-chain amino acid ABC transporter permease [Actinobacteria bacterium YIM 96077]RAW09186.1 branched-chain amino acid ABC transporter permease [Phytoactinopolyspora halophila]